MENPIEMDDLGVPPFSETPISSHPSSHRATWVHTFASGLFSRMPSSKASNAVVSKERTA